MIFDPVLLEESFAGHHGWIAATASVDAKDGGEVVVIVSRDSIEQRD